MKLRYILLSLIIITLAACKRKSFEDRMIEEARSFTMKQCPRRIDNCTTIDSMTFDRTTSSINYYYTLEGQLDDSTSMTPSVIEDFQENMLVRLRDDISLKKQKEYGITFTYHYFSKSRGKEIMTLSFDKEAYTKSFTPHSFNYREARNMREFTKAHCPIRQDEIHALDSIWYDSISRTLYYDYTVCGEFDVDSIYTQDDFIKESLHADRIKSIRKDEGLTVERDKEKLNFCFRYFSESRKNMLVEVLIKNSELTK